jgi:hypothetical protein
LGKIWLIVQIQGKNAKNHNFAKHLKSQIERKRRLLLMNNFLKIIIIIPTSNP